MNHYQLTLFATVSFSIFAGCGSSSSAPAAKYLALGDSYTIGQSVDIADRWPVQLSALLHQQNIELGDPQIIARTGWRSDELLAALDTEHPQGPFSLVSLLIGVNNQFQQQSIDQFRTDFIELLNRSIKLAGGNANHVIVLSIPDWGVTPFAAGRDPRPIATEIDAFNSICRTECASRQIAFIDITPISRTAPQDRTLIANDGLHPSGKMYRLWAEVAAPIVAAALR